MRTITSRLPVRRSRRAVVLVAAASLVAVAVQRAAPGRADSFAGTWAELQAGFQAGGTVRLDADVMQSDGEHLTVGDAPVTLDLDGHSLSIGSVSSGAGIEVGGGASFTVTDSAGGGSLTAEGSYSAAGIGGSAQTGGTITITGGTVTATGGYAAAGIGGGNGGASGTISISGGTVIATGGGYGAGIGAGADSADAAAGTITISGGTVTAHGTQTGPGIGGGGFGGSAGTVSVSAGTVTATGGDEGAGIGNGSHGAGGMVTVSGGTVTATGGFLAAGIGGGIGPDSGRSAAASVSGGSVTATGGTYGAGIGGGLSGAGTTVSLTGGAVSASGGVFGAGIGGGYHSSGGGFVTIGPDGSATASNGQYASAVGAGYLPDGTPDFGSLSNAGLLTVPSGATLTVPAGASADNSGLLELGGTLAGAGTVSNTGRIVTATLGGAVSANGQGPAGTNLLVNEHNYDLSFDTRGASSSTPPDEYVYATSLATSDQSLPAAPVRAGHPFTGWFTAATGGTQVDGDTDLTQLVNVAGPTALTLYAQYLPEQTVEFTNLPEHPQVGDTVAVSVSGGPSGNPVVVSVDPSTPGYGTPDQVCTVDSAEPPAGAQAVIDFVHVGACALDADQAEGGDYSAGHAQEVRVIGQGSQTVTFTSSVPVGAHVGDTYSPAATGGASGQPVTFSIDDASSGVCSLDEAGTTVTFDHAGSCVVDADQDGTDDYAAASQAHQQITVGKLAQTITFTSTAPARARVGDTYSPTATGGASGEPVTFGIAEASASVCSIDGTGTTVTFDHPGTCIVTADQAGTDDYAAATQQRQTIAVVPAVEPRLFTPLSPQARALDTRSGVGAPKAKVGPGASIVLSVPFLPAGARAVVLNLTAAGLTGAASTSVSACSVAASVAACAATSVLNVTSAGPIANEITVPVSDDGKIRLYNRVGNVDLIGDVVGYLADGYTPAGPARVYDSRISGQGGPVPASSSRVVTLPNVPSGARAAIVNLTAVGLAGAPSTYLSACSAVVSQADCAKTSVLNVSGPGAIANEVTVPIGADGKIRLYNSTGRINVVVDVAGYLTAGYSATTPTRVLDTRVGVGAAKRPVGTDSAVVLAVPHLPVGATAVIVNVTALGLTGATSTYVKACRSASAGADCAQTSTLNVFSAAPVANEVTIPVDGDGTIRLYNRAGSINMIVDLVGVIRTS